MRGFRSIQCVSEPSTSQVRAWARAQGLQVSDYGRLPAAITQAYRDAHAAGALGAAAGQAQPQEPAPAAPVGQPGWQTQYSSRPPGGWPLDVTAEPPPPGTNGWSVAALVLGLLGIGPVALVCGVIGFRQTRRTGQAGRGLAISGVVLGVLTTIGVVLLVASDTEAQRADNGALISAGLLPLKDLRTGDCLRDLPFDRPSDPVAVQPCQGIHAAEVFFAFEAAGTEYPGPDALLRSAQSKCQERLEATEFVAPIDTYELLTIIPTRERWDDRDRRMHCLITGASGATLVDSELSSPGT